MVRGKPSKNNRKTNVYDSVIGDEDRDIIGKRDFTSVRIFFRTKQENNCWCLFLIRRFAFFLSLFRVSFFNENFTSYSNIIYEKKVF